MDKRVAIVTGASRGIGRAIAKRLARDGRHVVAVARNAEQLKSLESEIAADGGSCEHRTCDMADGQAVQRMVEEVTEKHGRLDILVNNAGILRDRVLVNMTEAEWDAVIAVHLKGHFAPTRHAAVYWREQAKAGVTKPRNIVHTSSTSGLFSNPGQGNYGAAKSGIATFSQICAKELARYNVKSNAIAPAARTRLTLATPGLEEVLAPKAGEFDKWDPANVSPLVAYLSSDKCEFTGETFFVQGGQVTRVQSWTNAETIDQDDRWSVSALASAMSSLKPKS